ncbi:hypothetical protein G7Y79_00034g069890 [Physcia stellaris]|nr:hypothetical protein G7Y79_00034g069890 [Physcia stellaris]
MALEQQFVPNSQSSSFDGSQGSQYAPVSSGSFTSSQTRPPRDVTPSTSLSNPSSQEHMAKMNQPVDYRSSREPALLETRPLQAPVANMGGPHREYTSAPKRTADGQLKQGNSISPTSPSKTSKHDHSRTSSTTSRSSQIGDLSATLKTRLTYAMVKVQNGWESRNINDLEAHITSAQTSPISTTSTLRRPYDFPRPGSSSTQPDRSSVGFMQSSERSTATATPENVSSAPHQHTGTAGLDYAYHSATQSPPSASSGRTYESFWREHSHSNSNKPLGPVTASSPAAKATRPSLAPPADIAPRAPARRTQPISSPHHPPRLQTGPSTTMPATPPPPSSQSSLRAPRENTAEDMDAIETLVYMSSPKNPSYNPSPQRKQAVLPKTPLRHYVDSSVGQGRAEATRLKTVADVDRLLDEMGSSSDEEAVDGDVDVEARVRA